MKEIEIILVDDGSTDGSGKLCDQYATADPRICVLHKENEGLSAARNDGIQMAHADFIMFADGDDWVEPGFCELPYLAAKENNVEIVCFRYVSIYNNWKKVNSKPQGKGLIPKGNIVALKQIEATAWSKMYCKHLFDNLHFPEGRVYEDIATTHRILHAASGIFVLDQHLYNYCIYRPGSITETASQKNMADHCWALSRRFQDFESWGIDMSDERYVMALSHLIKYGRKTEFSNRWSAILREKERLRNNISWKQNIALSLYHISPFLFDIVCVLTKRRKIRAI